MNKQQIMKPVRIHPSDGSVLVHSIFYTIQGEGPFCGTPCVFIRLAGCNLQCPACDTDYTSTREMMTPDELTAAVHNHMPRPGLVVITGGEPFRQGLRLLLHALVAEGHYVQIESNGTLEPPSIVWNQNTSNRKGVYLVVSPKTGKLHQDILYAACALKYVVEVGNIDAEDGLPIRALRHRVKDKVARPPVWWTNPVYIQPMDEHDEERNRAHMQAAVYSSLKHGYILQLQVHKIINVE